MPFKKRTPSGRTTKTRAIALTTLCDDVVVARSRHVGHGFSTEVRQIVETFLYLTGDMQASQLGAPAVRRAVQILERLNGIPMDVHRRNEIAAAQRGLDGFKTPDESRAEGLAVLHHAFDRQQGQAPPDWRIQEVERAAFNRPPAAQIASSTPVPLGLNQWPPPSLDLAPQITQDAVKFYRQPVLPDPAEEARREAQQIRETQLRAQWEAEARAKAIQAENERMAAQIGPKMLAFQQALATQPPVAPPPSPPIVAPSLSSYASPPQAQQAPPIDFSKIGNETYRPGEAFQQAFGDDLRVDPAIVALYTDEEYTPPQGSNGQL